MIDALHAVFKCIEALKGSMVPPLLAAAILGPTIAQLVTGPLNSFLSTIIPHENLTLRNITRMIASGVLPPESLKQLNAWQKLAPEDRRVAFLYAQALYQNRAEIEVRELQSPLLREGVQVFKKLDEFDTAEFLGTLDDATKRLNEAENELERLDRQERDAWMKEELAFNTTLTRIVEDRIKQAARAS